MTQVPRPTPDSAARSSYGGYTTTVPRERYPEKPNAACPLCWQGPMTGALPQMGYAWVRSVTAVRAVLPVADLANAQERNNRLHARVRHLEHKPSEMLGEHAWRESGLGAPDDIEQLKLRIVHLEQQVHDLTKQRDEKQSELDAARVANRQLMAQLNSRRTS